MYWTKSEQKLSNPIDLCNIGLGRRFSVMIRDVKCHIYELTKESRVLVPFVKTPFTNFTTPNSTTAEKATELAL